MNTIENLYDEFFNSKDTQQANLIIDELLKLHDKEKAHFYRLLIGNFKESQRMVSIMISYLHELGQHEELKKRMFPLFRDKHSQK